MDLDDLFASYYALYRVEAVTPASTDDEYIIFKLLAKEGVNRWANYDNTFWKELFQTLQREGDGDLTIVSGQTEYATPENMRIAGGFVHLRDSTGVTKVRVPIIEPQDAQFRNDNSKYAYFIGDPNNGFSLEFNGLDTSWVGLSIDYIYYKKPTILTDGTNLTEMTQPFFLVHRALANRFRGSRNPYYQSAKNDAEDVLKTMQMENNSGNWADPWRLADNSGSTWGA